MNKSRFLGFLALSAVAAFALAAQDTFKLSRTAKTGDTAKYELKANLTVQGMEVTFSANIADKVVKVDEDGSYTIESSRSNIKIIVGGQELPAGDASEGAGTTKYTALGEPLEITGEGAGPEGMRMAMMSNFIAPKSASKIGDKWSHEYKPSEKNGNVGGKAEYEILATEKVGDFDTVVVRISYKETTGSAPASSEGKAWIDVKDGNLVKLEAELKDAPLEAAGGPVNMKIVMNRVP